MANTITQQVQDTKQSEQNVFNNTYDTDFDVIAVEALGYDGTVLRRIGVTADGSLKVAL